MLILLASLSSIGSYLGPQRPLFHALLTLPTHGHRWLIRFIMPFARLE